MKGRLIIHLVHISGKRMIGSGVNGLSSGVIAKKVMRGKNALSFVNINMKLEEKIPVLIECVKS